MRTAWGLPAHVEFCGEKHSINPYTDTIEYLMEIFQNAEYEQDEKYLILLRVFYKDWQAIQPEQYPDAINAAFEFMDGSRSESGGKGNGETLVRWEQDLPLIISTINTMLGRDIRNEPLHWWTFLGYFQNIPSDSLFSLVLSIRSKLRKGQLKDKAEREFYNKNRNIIDIKRQYTETEKEIDRMWGIKVD